MSAGLSRTVSKSTSSMYEPIVGREPMELRLLIGLYHTAAHRQNEEVMPIKRRAKLARPERRAPFPGLVRQHPCPGMTAI
jgi:hypothetical protein